MPNYFKLGQVRQVIAGLGKTWQPFGGAGFLVMVGMLLLALLLACCFVLLPLWITRRKIVPSADRPGDRPARGG